jgi:hypothetical protein
MFITNSLNNLFNTLDGILDKMAPFYVYILMVFHIAYVFLYIGVVSLNKAYLRELNIAIQLFVCVFLIIRFFPMRKYVLKEYDPNIIFGSATFLLLNLGFIEVVSKYLPASIANKIQ